MNTEQRIALELESNRKATQCDVYAAAIAQAVRCAHEQTVEPLVPRRGEKALERSPVGNAGLTVVEGVLT
jgi:hypothetical protein